MLSKRYYYNQRIAICPKDMLYIRSLKTGNFGKKSLAGILSFIIQSYASKLSKMPKRNVRKKTRGSVGKTI